MAGSLSPIDEEPTVSICRLCNEQPKEPKLLPCLDSFCFKCIDFHIKSTEKDGEFHCPSCKSVTKTPIGGAANLQSSAADKQLDSISDIRSGSKCKLCFADKLAYLYCTDCSLPMCTTCLAQHASVKGTSDHSIIPILKEETSKPPSSRNGHYKGDPYLLGCESCINGTCVLHSTHDLSRASGHNFMIPLRSSFVDYQKSVLSLAGDASRYLDTLKNACRGAEIVICNQAQKLHHDIEDQKDKLIQEIRHKHDKHEVFINKQMTDIKKSENNMIKTYEYLENVITYTQTVELAEKSKVMKHGHSNVMTTGIESQIGHHHPTIQSSPMEDTDCNKLKDHRNSLILGKLHLDSGNESSRGKKSSKSKTRLSVLTSFTVDESLTEMAITIDDTLVVTSYSTKKCSIYTMGGECVRNITKGLVQPITVLAMSTGKLLVADAGDSNHKMGFKMYYTDGELFHCNFSIIDAPWGMAETNNGDLIICHPETRRVSVYDRKGHMKMTLKSEDGRNLFSNPRCVCVNTNGDIIISDFGRHSVFFFDSEGQYKFSYGSEGSGPGQFNHPCGICSDMYGNIIITDSDNHRVHLLKSDGTFRRFLVTHRDSIDEPVAVCVTQDEQLIIGEWSGKITVFKYN